MHIDGDCERRAGRVWLRAIGILLALLALTECSSSPGASTPTAPSSTVAPRSSVSPTSHASDQALADEIVLAARDLPGTWVAGPREQRHTDGDAQLTHCLGIPNSDAEHIAFTGSPVFSLGPTQIYSTTIVATSVAIVLSDLRGQRSPRMPRCLEQTVMSFGATHVRVSSDPLPVAAGSLLGFRLTGSQDRRSSSGRVVRIAMDQVTLGKGRLEVTILAAADDGSVPAGLMDAATAAIVSRLDKVTG